MILKRFDRNVRFFGEEGQNRLRNTNVVVVGVGGLGSHVVQQLSLLGVGSLSVIDDDEMDETSRNRLIGARSDDAVPGTLKVDVADRLARSIDSSIGVTKHPESFVTDRGFELISRADYVFGCLDLEGARLILTELCAAYARPYLDLASDIRSEDRTRYGGTVCFSHRGEGCPICLGVLDVEEAGYDLGGIKLDRLREAIYGVKRAQLGRSGPSVVSINGTVASLAVTEFMVTVTGVREPRKVLNYRGHLGSVGVPTDSPAEGCYFCKFLWGTRERADVQRYIREGFAEILGRHTNPGPKLPVALPRP